MSFFDGIEEEDSTAPIPDAEPDAPTIWETAHEDDTDAWNELSDIYYDAFADDYVMAPSPLPTGIASVDKTLGGGVPPVGVTIVGATAGTGKTALVLNWAYWWARSEKMRVLVFSLELPRHKVWERVVSLHSTMGGLKNVAWGDMGSVIDSVAGDGTRESLARLSGRQKYEASDRYIDRYREIDPVLVSWDSLRAHHVTDRIVVVDDRYELSQIVSIVRTLVGNGWRGPVVVDYAQMVQVPGVSDEYPRMTEVSRTLTRLAKDVSIPIVLISSLRNLNANELKDAPQLNWYRGSGYLGYDATCAIVLKRDGGSEGEQQSVEMYVTKNRQGRADVSAPLVFLGKYGRFQ